jgi:hypothetical protein
MTNPLDYPLSRRDLREVFDEVVRLRKIELAARVYVDAASVSGTPGEIEQRYHELCELLGMKP